MSRTYDNKIVFDEGGKISHPFIDMEGLEQISYNLENDAVRNYLNNVTYYKTDIMTSKGTQSTTKTKIRPYFEAKTYRYPYGSSKSAWSEITRPVIIANTRLNDEITFTSLDHTMKVTGTAGATLVYNLVPRRFYQYTVKRSGNVVKTGYFNTEGQCRMIRIQIPNFRDIGGWKCEGGTISYNKIFRGCGFAGTVDGEEDIEGFGYSSLRSPLNDYRDIPNKQDVIDSLVGLGITHELDLRDPNDTKPRQKAVDPIYPPNTISYKNVAIANYKIDSNLVKALKHVSDVLSAKGKLWLHCHTGADRAGTLVNVIQILLGCDIDAIIKEWELTMFCGNGYNETYLDGDKVTGYRAWLYNLYKNNKTLKENTIAALRSACPSNIDIDAVISNIISCLVTKTMAIVGDSYSAYTGSGPKVEIEGYKNSSVYAGEYPGYAMPIDKMWWAIVAKRFGWAVANYSWSGCPVTSTEVIPLDERVCSSQERVDRLSYLTGGTAPDIIFCMVGYNDANAIEKGNYGITLDRLDAAYRTMLTKITTRYPNAKIYCATNVQRSSSGPKFISYKNFNTRLATIVNSYSAATLVDIAGVFGNTASGNTVGDGTHPNERGFEKIAEGIIRQIEDISYNFAVNHCSSRGWQSGPSEYGYQMQTNTYTTWEFAEFPVSAGDEVHIGTNDGEKLLTSFAESANGFLSGMKNLAYAESISSGWYTNCFSYSYTGVNYTSDGKIYQKYIVQHNGLLTVGIKVNSTSSSARGGTYVRINGELKT